MEDTRYTWNKAFLEALELDTWGQLEEAASGYKRLHIAAAVESVENVLGLSPARRDAVARLAALLKLRVAELNAGASPASCRVGLGTMQALKPFVAGLIVSDVALPQAAALALKQAAEQAAGSRSGTGGASPAAARIAHARASLNGADAEAESVCHHGPCDSIAVVASASGGLAAAHKGSSSSGAAPGGGTLRPPLAAADLQEGDLTASLTFSSVSVKRAGALVDPHLVISVRDTATGGLLEAVQETPRLALSASTTDKLLLAATWHCQTPLNCLPDTAAVFIELRHTKPSKKSLKCFSLLDLHELSLPGPAALQLLRRKPCPDFRHTSAPLLTHKPHYLHLTRAVEQH